MNAVEILERLIADLAGSKRVLAFDERGNGPFNAILEASAAEAVARAEAELAKARLITGEVPL